MARYLCVVCLDEFEDAEEAEKHVRDQHDDDNPGDVRSTGQ